MGTAGSPQATTAPTAPTPTAPPIPALPQGRTDAIVVQPPPYRSEPPQIPGEVIPLAGMLMTTIIAVVIGYPIVRVISRYFDRRLDRTLVSAKEVNLQIRQLQDSLDTMSIELERISEAQRFSAKLLAERSEKP